MSTARWLTAFVATVGLGGLATAQGIWADNFDSYQAGSAIVGQGGWIQWNAPFYPPGNDTVSNAMSVSAPNSLSCDGDPVQEWSGYTSGQWVFKGKVFCPATTTEEFDFQMFSVYTPGMFGPTAAWNVLIQFNLPTQGSVRIWDGSGGTTSAVLPLDTWVDLKIIIDLDADTCEIQFGPNPPVFLMDGWTGGYYGGTGNYPKDIVAVSLLSQFVAPGQEVFWDDLTLGPDVPDPTLFCTAKSTNACGVPQIAYSGIPSATIQSGFVVSVSPARTCKSGILLYNQAQGASSLPFQGGTLCVEAMGLRRAGSTNSQGTPGGANCDGAFAIDINTFSKGAWQVPDCAGNPSGIQANNSAPFLNALGNSVYAQWWGRDSVATGSLVSDGLSWIVGP